MKILVLNGPNLNTLGDREPGIYGNLGYDELCDGIKSFCKTFSVDVAIYQSNNEGDIVTELQKAKDGFDGIVINAGALTHYSYAVYDAIKYAALPTVEVHISNIFNREDFRKTSVISSACDGVISGLGTEGYYYAIEYLKSLYQQDGE
ncbi:MAG: type II 3-dehydroquinate dehydratase [Clostridiales bacterium]|jgi:3-dehydroquinate dehydratase-2|nr:type II 3-dehydroquinate dehydratase [Clostridiales bacterium]